MDLFAKLCMENNHIYIFIMLANMFFLSGMCDSWFHTSITRKMYLTTIRDSFLIKISSAYHDVRLDINPNVA